MTNVFCVEKLLKLFKTKKFLWISKELGAEGAGSLLGIMSFDDVNKKIGIEANFQILQSLLLGILIENFSPSSLFKRNINSYVFKENQSILESKTVESTVYISPYNFTILKQTFATTENLLEVFYDDYIEIQGQNIPTKIRFTNDGLENLNIDIK